MIKYTQNFLQKLEKILNLCGYVLRYEKGNFKSGYCVLEERKIVVMNKFHPLEGRINCLIDILRNLQIDSEKIDAMDDKNKQLYNEILVESPAV